MVTYSTSRAVYIDGVHNGMTNQVLRVDAGTHEFDLGTPPGYAPAKQRVHVSGTSVLAPMTIAFT